MNVYANEVCAEHEKKNGFPQEDFKDNSFYFRLNPTFDPEIGEQWNHIGKCGTSEFFKSLIRINPKVLLTQHHVKRGLYRMSIKSSDFNSLTVYCGTPVRSFFFPGATFMNRDHYHTTDYWLPATFFIPLYKIPIISASKELGGLLKSLLISKRIFRNGDVVRILPTERILANPRWAEHVGKSFTISVNDEYYFKLWLEGNFASVACDSKNTFGINYLPSDLELC